MVENPFMNEQLRIVRRVDELLGLVDQLKSQLGEAGEAAVSLLDAMIAEQTGAG